MVDPDGRSGKPTDQACNARWGPVVVTGSASAQKRGVRTVADRQTDKCCASAQKRGAQHLTDQASEWSASAHVRGARHSIEIGPKERSFARNGKLKDGWTSKRCYGCMDENMTVCSFAVGAFGGAILV